MRFFYFLNILVKKTSDEKQVYKNIMIKMDQ